MSKYRTEDIRNLALAGHRASGKTSLADALLFQAKAVDRKGSVEDGSSFADFDEEARHHRFSIDTTLLNLDHHGHHVNLLDTPGAPDFVGNALTALNAVETVLLAVSAVNGVEVNTRRMFAEAGKRGLARMIVINKVDADNGDFGATLAAIRETFGKTCVLFNAPINPGPGFSGVVCVLTHGGGKVLGCPVDLKATRSQLVDAIVESDEAMMEKFLTVGEITNDELTAAIPVAMEAGTLIPIFCASAKKGIGMNELLEAVADYAPNPTQAPPRKAFKRNGAGDVEVVLKADPHGECVGQVFKAVSDKFVGNLSFIRLYSGTYKHDQALVNARTEKGARSGGLLRMQGAKHTPMQDAAAGDIIAVSKVDDLHIGDTVGTGAHPPRLADPSFPRPLFGLAVEPKARGDEQKISGSLAKIANEDPTFKVTRDAQTHELVITGMSQLHLDVMRERLKRRFGLDVNTHEPKVPYRETITAAAEGTHKHKKQSGGRGQFAEVHFRIYPLPREITSKEQFFEQFANKSRFEKLREDHCQYDPEHNFGFVDTIVGGTIPPQYIPGVQKGAKELLERGALAGFRMQDVALEVHFGKYHDVDSSEAAFKTASRIAFKNAFLAARPVLLEPIVHIEVTVPTKFTGAILGDLNTKRARIENQDSVAGDLTAIIGTAPLSAMTRYKASLDSITAGTGSYSMEFSHYDQVPSDVQQNIVKNAKMAADEEE
ncbi:MAG: elongation factor G [Gemmataceae bacterium]